MMSRRGHEIIHYGHRNSKVECNELVAVIEPETYDTLYGNVFDIRKNQYTILSDDSEMYSLIAGNTIYEISKRKQPGDFLLLFGGYWNKRVADAHQDMFVVEPAIGYPASFCNYKVYPSYACLHSFVQDANIQMNYYHVVIPHYFDVDDFDATQPKEDYFLFVGRLNFDKGVTIAIQLTERIGARLKVCGQGNLSSLGYDKIPEHVDFIGYVGVEERKKLMAKAKCLIMPTLYMEPFGCVAIEGMLSGTPILTNDWGGPGENNVHGVTGFKCRTFEQFEWAARNIHLIKPKNCREWAEKNFSFDKIGHMYEEYFQSLQGIDWYKQNPSRTNLDHLTKHYPTSSTEYKWCVVVFAHGDIFYAPDSKRVLEDYFKFNGIPYYFVTEKPSFDTKDAHPSWWKLKVHSMFPVYDFIITWDLDLLPRSRDIKVIHEFDMTKLCMVRDSSVPDTENGYSPCKYNGGLIGIPKTFQAFMENIFDRCAPGGFNDGWEQGHLNQAIYECNIQLYELPRKLNGLYSTQYFQDALLQHYTHGDNAKYKISEHHNMYFDVNVDKIRSLVPKHCERSEVGVACDNLWDKDRQPVHPYSIVVAKFNENIEWTKELGGNVIIYDKSVPPLKNIGREAETYLRYIIEHYNNLPEYVIFLQGNPYDTMWSYTSVKDGLKPPDIACPFVAPWTEDPISRYPETYCYRDYYFLLFGEHYSESTIRFATGAQWSVPRHCITHRPLDFYRKLHRMISKAGNPSLDDVRAQPNFYDKYSIDAWMLERLWAPIFNIQVPTSREFISKYSFSHLNQDSTQKVIGPIQDDEALMLYSVIRGNRMTRILEIGGLSGYSARNFIEALEYSHDGILYTVDIQPVPIMAKNHKVIVKDVNELTPHDVDNSPLDLVFFDCHSVIQRNVFVNFLNQRLITYDTVIALHDTNLHWSPDSEIGIIHQPVERNMMFWLKDMGYQIFSIRTSRDKHSETFPFRHGLTLCQLTHYPTAVARKIPYNLFQTFKTKEISPALQAFVDTWKEHNPEYTYKFYDDDMCDQFMKEFDVRAWKAYRRIIPGAFKADLWRYCILYKYGGVYVDVDTVCLGKIDDFLNETTEFVTPIDLDDKLLYNTFIAAAPGSKILKDCIDTIVHNVENNIVPDDKIYFSACGVLANCTNEFMGRDKQASFAGQIGWHDHGKIHLLNFEIGDQHVKDEKGMSLLQNKEKNHALFNAYHHDLKRLNLNPWFYCKDVLREDAG